jgi:hypothetical protein
VEGWNQPPVSTVLNNIDRIGGSVTATCADGRGEWFVLKSNHFLDELLFVKLKGNWLQIVPLAETRNFVLILCRSGPNSGVWLHHLSTPVLRADYLPGCHDVISWA